MERLLKWFFLLNKRLYKKASFVAILCIIPIFAILFGAVARSDSGFLHIVLAPSDDDALTNEIIDNLLSEDSIIRFSVADSPIKAINQVKQSKADAAWIFAPDAEEKLNFFVEGKRNGEKVVRVVIREQNVFLHLAEEKIFMSVYEHCAKEYMISFARTNISQLDNFSDEKLLEYFENVSINEDLFEFGSMNSDEVHLSESNYLLSPLKGLFGILSVLCGMAAVMYYMQDEERGTFSLVPENKRFWTAFVCVLIAVLNITLASFIALAFLGLTAPLWMEILSIVPFAISCTLFCLVLAELFRSIRLYGAIIPLLTVIMIALCPVFFDIRGFMWLQIIFPPTYYVKILYNSNQLLYMLIYSLILAGILFVFKKIRRRTFI